MFVLPLGLLLVFLPLIPIWMKTIYRRSALMDTKTQLRVYWGFQVCLATAIFLSFFLAVVAFFFSYQYLASYLTGVSLDMSYWDLPLTPRGLLFLIILMGTPYLIFSKVGLVSIRDAHQICKEQRDRLGKRKKTGWSGL